MAANHVPYQPYPTAEPAGGNPHIRENIDVNPNMFGANIGQAVEHAGNQFGELALKQAEMDNDIYASKSTTAAVREMTDALGDYSQKEGYAAVHGFTDYQNKIDDITQKYVDAAPNEQAKRDLARVIRGNADRYYGWGDSHRNKQRGVAEKRATDDTLDLQINQAGLAINQRDAAGVPVQTEQLLATGERALRESYHAQGWDVGKDGRIDNTIPDRDAAKYYGNGYKKVIGDQIAIGDLPTAVLLYNRNAPKMDAGSRVDIEKALRPKIDEYNVNAINDPLMGEFTGERRTTEVPTEPTATKDVTGRLVSNQRGQLKLRDFAPSEVQSGAQPTPQVAAPKIEDISADAGFGYRAGHVHDVDGLVVHHTGGGGGVDGVLNTFRERGVSSQYIMDRDGQVYRVLPEGAVAHHMMNGTGAGAGFGNRNTEGIEVIARDNDDWTPAQKKAILPFIQWHQQKFGYNQNNVFGHGEVNPGHKEETEGMQGVSQWRGHVASGSDTSQALNDVSGGRGIKPGVISSIINTESGWDAKNRSGRYSGLTQIGRATFDEAGGKLAGMTYDQYVNAGPAAQVKAYGAWLDHYDFNEKMRRNGIDFRNLPAEKQAAVLQGFQLGPNDERWMRAAGQGNWDTPVTSTRQATVLGSTSLNDMAAYYGGNVRADQAQTGTATAAPSRAFTAYAGYGPSRQATAQAQTGTATDASFAGSPRQAPEPGLTEEDLKGDTPQDTDIIKRAYKITEGDDPKFRHKVIADLKRRLSDFHTANKADIGDLNDSVPNAIKLAMQGKEGVTIDEPRIRALLPPQKAEKWISEFHIAQEGGKLVRESQWASPERLDDIEYSLNSGHGIDAMRLRTARGAPPKGPATVGADPDADLGGDHIELRKKIAGEFKTLRNERDKALANDPVDYVSGAPYLAPYQAALAGAEAQYKANPKDPNAENRWRQAQNRYALASMNFQKALGVPDEKVHLLDRKTAIDITRKITGFGVDSKTAMDRMEQTYGDNWGVVAQDLVSHGGLPVGYQAMRVLDQQNAEQLSEFYKQLGAPEPKKSGGGEREIKAENKTAEEYAKTWLPPKAFHDDTSGNVSIRTLIQTDPGIQTMRLAYQRMGYDKRFQDSILGAVEDLAYAKTIGAKDFNNWTTHAHEAIDAFKQRYEILSDTKGPAMIPREYPGRASSDDTLANMSHLVGNLSVKDIHAPMMFGKLGIHSPYNEKGEYVGHEGGKWMNAQTAEVWLSRLKGNPSWMNSPDGKGLWLTDANVTHEARVHPVMGKDGKPIMVRFADPAPAGYSARRETPEPTWWNTDATRPF